MAMSPKSCLLLAPLCLEVLRSAGTFASASGGRRFPVLCEYDPKCGMLHSLLLMIEPASLR